MSAIQWFIPPGMQRSAALLSRAQNVLNAVVAAAVSGPFYAFVYYRLGYPAAALEILACCAVMFSAPLLLRSTGSIAIARETFLFGAFFNFTWLSYHLGGIGAPTVAWLITPPIVAMLIGGVASAMAWLAMSCAAVALLYALPLWGIALPPNPIRDMPLLSVLCDAGLIPVVMLFVLLFEVTKNQGFIRLEQALGMINELAIRDELTGSHNRRHLLELIERERERSTRSARPFCLCLLDVDFFKRINDSYGHSAGDVVLRTFAHAVQRQVRATDAFGRYGGEEFLLMLPETTQDEAVTLVERIRADIEALEFGHIAASLALTVSIGVAQFRQGEAIGRTIARADEALYRAKSGGRNRVRCHAEPADAPDAVAA
jgi:diguanylate cyclase (GGDEF)-like protein